MGVFANAITLYTEIDTSNEKLQSFMSLSITNCYIAIPLNFRCIGKVPSSMSSKINSATSNNVLKALAEFSRSELLLLVELVGNLPLGNNVSILRLKTST